MTRIAVAPKSPEGDFKFHFSEGKLFAILDSKS